MATADLGGLWKEASKHPAVLVAGLGGVGLLAVLAVSRGQDTTGADPAATTDPAAGDVLGSGEGGDTPTPAGSDTGSPYFGPPGGGYDPFSGTGTDPYAEPTTAPAWYETPPDWWKPPTTGGNTGAGTSAGGCPLPKPTLPPNLVGKYKMACVKKTWRLVPVHVTTPMPPPVPQKAPNVSRGGHATFHGHKNARGHLILDHRKVITLAHAAHWTLGPAVSGDTTPGRHGGEIRVRKIIAAPGHAGQVGRFLKVG